MRVRDLCSLMCVTLSIVAGSARRAATQTPAARPRGDTVSIFAPLQLRPAPSALRLATGAPGAAYWQNRADYALHATLDTITGTVHGTLQLRYTNHSPDTLRVLWLQTEQNRFQNDAEAALGDPLLARTYGYRFESCTQHVRGTTRAISLDRAGPETLGTETRATLPAPIPPGGTTVVTMAWHFVVPEIGDNRMGRERTLYLIAQWYPRVNVYDDVNGWNLEPYIRSEFYLEYGDFDLAVTVPATYIVAATGTLMNPEAVLTSTQQARLQQARTADTVVHIVTAAELTSGAAHRQLAGMVTWRFHAANVRDMAWAASPTYQWDATQWHGILAHAYYRSAAQPRWVHAADMARSAMQEYSERWAPYPYPQISVAEGHTVGMEYPMLSFDLDVQRLPIPRAVRDDDEYQILTHEIGHNWFPMMVGSNERVHAWMDEGFNTFINTFSEASRYPERGDQVARADRYLGTIERAYQARQITPMDLPADSGVYNAYGGPAGVLEMLRHEILGPARFDRAFRTYIRRWTNKHPTPADFFRTMNQVSGEDLDWYWREWFYETPGFDQAIDRVTTRVRGDTNAVTVDYANRARGVLPLVVRFTFQDSSTHEVRYPATVWRTAGARYRQTYPFVGKTVVRIALDPDHHLVDTNRDNNTWTPR